MSDVDRFDVGLYIRDGIPCLLGSRNLLATQNRDIAGWIKYVPFTKEKREREVIL